jgi:DNA replication and repair protein RecF
MVISWIRTSGFRNLSSGVVRLSEGINAFVGPNAQGKTNLLEAVALLANGRSFRGAKIPEMICSDQMEAGVEGHINGKSNNIELKIYMNRSSRQYHVNNKPVSDLRDFLGQFSYVVFSAECMAIVDGDPAARRHFLDHGYFCLHPSFLLMLRSYRKILKSRNATIKQFNDNRQLVTSWNEPLGRLGASIVHSRLEYLETIRENASEAHRLLTDGNEQLDLEYNSLWLSQETMQTMDKNAFMDEYRVLLDRELQGDLRRGSTSFGPHRDELRILINGKDIRHYGSRGQKRTALMALKLSELNVFYTKNDEYPVFILDDIASELDRSRQTGLVRALPEDLQILISHTDTLDSYFDRPVHYLNVSEGHITYV